MIRENSVFLMHDLRKWTTLVLAGLFIVLFLVPAVASASPEAAVAKAAPAHGVISPLASASPNTLVGVAAPPWYHPSWSRRSPVTVSGSTAVLVNYQVKITVPYDSDMKSDFSDLRFTAGDGVTLVPFWVEKVTASSSAILWVRVPSIPAAGSSTLYLYYGNPGAAGAGDGPRTFEFFDDFESPYAIIWTEKQALPAPRADLSAAVSGGKLYAFGGYGTNPDDARAETYVYDPATNTWTQKASMPTPRWGMVAVAHQGKVYVFGGSGAGNVHQVYDVATDTWVTKAPMPSDLAGQGLMGVLYGDRIHLFYRSAHYEYDPSSDTYTAKAPVPTPRTWGTCAAVGDTIYVIGGYSYGSPTGPTNVNEAYSPAANSWTVRAPMPVAKYGVTRENPVINGKIYVTHGLNGGFRVDNYVYNPASNAWEQKSAALYARDGVACGVINGRLYVVGGRSVMDNPYGLATHEEYDPSTDTGTSWTFSDVTRVQRSSQAAYEGQYGLLINDDTASNVYAEHPQAMTRFACDLNWDLTDALGASGNQPQGRITLVDPTLATYGTLYYLNTGVPAFAWYRNGFTQLQAGSYNTWYRVSLVWDGANSRVIITGPDGVEHPYPVAATAATSDRIRLESMGAEQTRMFVDLLRVRQYSSPEPAGTLGIEEQQEQQPNPVPAISALAPSSAVAGSPAFTLTVTGTKFLTGSVVRWNGADRPTTYVSATQLTAVIPAPDVASPGTKGVTVFNPAPGGGTSNAKPFIVKRTTQTTLTHSLSTINGNRYVTLKAQVLDTLTGQPLFTTGSPYYYVQFYLDGSYIGMSRINGPSAGANAKYAVLTYRARAGTHTAIAAFPGSTLYGPAKSPPVTFQGA